MRTIIKFSKKIADINNGVNFNLFIDIKEKEIEANLVIYFIF